MDRRQHRRNRRVTTKANDDGRPQSAQQPARLHYTKYQFGEPSDGWTRCAAELSRSDAMGFDPRQTSEHRISSPVAREMDPDPTAQQFVRQRLRREQMAAGPARGQHECDAHAAVPESRRRVSASIIPMPSPSAINEDAPYERKGSVIPLVGIKCKLDAMFMAACNPNWINKPVAPRSTNKLPSSNNRKSPRSTMKANSPTTTRQTMRPNSSPATAKTKSACASGSTSFTWPSPGPRPQSPPLATASIERFT